MTQLPGPPHNRINSLANILAAVAAQIGDSVLALPAVAEDCLAKPFRYQSIDSLSSTYGKPTSGSRQVPAERGENVEDGRRASVIKQHVASIEMVSLETLCSRQTLLIRCRGDNRP